MAPLRGIGLIVALATVASACATLHPVERQRNPYRSAMLNADFESAYPRPTHYDPFGLSADNDEPPAYAEQNTNRSALATPQDARPSPPAPSMPPAQLDHSAPGPPDDSYAPETAAAFIAAVYAANETATTDSGSESPSVVDIYRHAQRESAVYHSTRPAVGDLVFFHNTYDRNGDGRNNDWYTHVGVVESVDDSGQVAVLSYLGGGVTRTQLNLDQPDRADGNTVMRQRNDQDPPYTQYLASELFAGFANLLGDRAEFLVIDNWQPGMNVAAAD